MADLRYAWRMFTKRPGFTAVVVLTLALGIGLNTAVFSAVEALLLRPLPGAREPASLAQLFRTYPGDQIYGSFSIPHFQDVRARSKDVLEDVAVWAFANLSVTASGEPARIFGQIVSANFFDVMGVTAAQGRTFVAAENEGRGAHPVVVLSDNGWRSVFGGDPDIVGKDVLLNGMSYRVVGITPPEFMGPLPMIAPVLWAPLMQVNQLRPSPFDPFESRGNNFMTAVARVRPGVSTEQVQQHLTAINAELEREYPDNYARSGMNVVPQLEAGLHPSFRDQSIGLGGAVMAVVALLLLVACVNVANLFLARGQDRAREMATRLALGASRFALVRQLLVESLLYAVIAGGVGLLVAFWALKLANSIQIPMDITFQPRLTLSPRVLGFAMITALVTGVLVGIVPALRATRPSLIPALKGEAPAGGSRSRLMRGLIVAQMSLSLVLLVCAGLFVANLRDATAVDKGFRSDGALMAELDPGLLGASRAVTLDFYDRLTIRLRAMPGVGAVGLIDNLPLGFSNSDRGISIPGYVPAENERMSIRYASVSPGYFEAMGIAIAAGRAFGAEDDSAAASRIIVNERFAERFWPGQPAEGRTVKVGGSDYTVIGVVPTGKYERLGEPPTEFMYFALRQMYGSGMTVVIRTAGDPQALVAVLRQEVRALNPNLPVANVRTLDSHLGIALLPARVTGVALAVFGVLGLLLAAVGMYGVMAYSVVQRTREIGIRMAVGAAARDVVLLLLRQGMTLVVIGIALGLVAAWVASQLLRTVLYGDGGFDPLTFTVVPLVLLLVSALATWAPARRAAHVHPAITLRAD